MIGSFAFTAIIATAMQRYLAPRIAVSGSFEQFVGQNAPISLHDPFRGIAGWMPDAANVSGQPIRVLDQQPPRSNLIIEKQKQICGEG